MIMGCVDVDSKKLAWNIRKDAITMVHEHHASHIASALSVADMLAVLYADILHVDPQKPEWENRDRFILSKGHAGVAVYATLAEMGYFQKTELSNYYSDGSVYSGHVSHKGVPGVEFSTGSLGHGVCVAAGMALAAKKKQATYRVYSIIGDGECEEGSIWEMALFARQQQLGNLTVLIDHNKMQAMGNCSDIMDLENLFDKWRAFGWHTIHVQDGNNHDQLRAALQQVCVDVPTCIIAETVKGKGVSFMENQLIWHYRDPQGEAYEQAMKEMEAVHHA